MPATARANSFTLRKAVIPAAGLGTRMRSLTNGAAKELLPFGGKPLIGHVIDEALAAGLNEICVVIREDKSGIADYVRAAYTNTDEPHIESSRGCEFCFVYQREPLGLGDALRQAREFAGNDSFLMMIPDQLLAAKTPAARQLISAWSSGATILSSMVSIPKDDIAFFGGARGLDFIQERDKLIVKRVLTDKETETKYRDHPNEVRGFGRTIYPPGIFAYLGPEFANPATGEVDLWRTFAALAGRIEHRGVVLEGRPMDFGTVPGYEHYVRPFQENE